MQNKNSNLTQISSDLFTVYDVYSSEQLKEYVEKEKKKVYTIEAILSSRGEYEYMTVNDLEEVLPHKEPENFLASIFPIIEKQLEDISKAIEHSGIDIEEKPTTDSKTSDVRVPIGIKHNSNKPSLDIVLNRQFPKALQLVSLATEFGHNKYKEVDEDYLNFKNVKGGSQTYFDAAARHNTERDKKDSQSNLPHIIHVAWNYLAALELWVEENKIDVKEFTENYLSDLHNSK